jgi:ribosomal subunit interface protein
MKLHIRYRFLSPLARWQGLIKQQLEGLEHLSAIASAQVTLERQRHAKPAYRVQALLEVPGPDFHADACDHTLQAALQKVVKNLERQIRSRKARRADRRKTNLQLGLLPGHSSLSLAGHRA